jgi:HPt (histidine-containing phosphotransfer) domain-containing protein
MTMQEQLRCLIERHHTHLHEQIATVGRLLALQNEDRAHWGARVVEAQGITHQLKGTAGSMGFANVGAAANVLDESLKVLKSTQDSISPEQLDGSLVHLETLRRIAEQTTPEMSALYNADLSRLSR